MTINFTSPPKASRPHSLRPHTRRTPGESTPATQPALLTEPPDVTESDPPDADPEESYLYLPVPEFLAYLARRHASNPQFLPVELRSIVSAQAPTCQ